MFFLKLWMWMLWVCLSLSEPNKIFAALPAQLQQAPCLPPCSQAFLGKRHLQLWYHLDFDPPAELVCPIFSFILPWSVKVAWSPTLNKVSLTYGLLVQQIFITGLEIMENYNNKKKKKQVKQPNQWNKKSTTRTRKHFKAQPPHLLGAACSIHKGCLSHPLTRHICSFPLDNFPPCLLKGSEPPLTSMSGDNWIPLLRILHPIPMHVGPSPSTPSSNSLALARCSRNQLNPDTIYLETASEPTG